MEQGLSSGTIGRACFLYTENFKQRTMADTVDSAIFVKRSKVEKKILRKQLKASHILLKHEGISTVSQPTKVMLSRQLTRSYRIQLAYVSTHKWAILSNSFYSLLFAMHPRQRMVVANGGLGNGVSRQELSAVLKEFGEVERLVMPPQKPYAFVTYRYCIDEFIITT